MIFWLGGNQTCTCLGFQWEWICWLIYSEFLIIIIEPATLEWECETVCTKISCFCVSSMCCKSILEQNLRHLISAFMFRLWYRIDSCSHCFSQIVVLTMMTQWMEAGRHRLRLRLKCPKYPRNLETLPAVPDDPVPLELPRQVRWVWDCIYIY